MLRDMLSTACKITKENQLEVFNSSKLGQWSKEDIILFQDYLEKCKDFWMDHKSTTVEWPKELLDNKFFATLNKMTPYFLSATVGRSIIIFGKKYGLYNHIVRKDMDEFKLPKYTEKEEPPIPIIKIKFKSQVIYQAITAESKLMTLFQQQFYNNRIFRLSESFTEDIMKRYSENSNDEGFNEEVNEDEDNKDIITASSPLCYNLPTVNDTETTTILNKEDQMKKCHKAFSESGYLKKHLRIHSG